jgi:putative transposase
MNYTSWSHTVFQHRYHIVWITRYRYKVVEGALRGTDTNDYPAGLQRTRRPDRLRRFVARTCPYVRGKPAAYCGQRLRSARQGTVIASGVDGVPGLAQALLGRHFWARGYFSTTSGNITDDVILQYHQEHEPSGVSR